MNQTTNKFKESSLFRLYKSFTPASRATILLALPFTVVDAVQYYTAGTTLIFSFPLLVLIYLFCGALAARIARQDGQELTCFARSGRSAALRLWLVSTVINTLVSILFGFASLGTTLLSGAAYLCLFAPFNALGSALAGWLGGWLYQQYVQRIITS